MDPATSEYVKSGHGVQEAEPVIPENVPLGQAAHILIVPFVFMAEYFPIGHDSQVDLFQARHLSLYPPTELHDTQLASTCW